MSPAKKKNRDEARALIQKAGYGPDKRLPIKISTRNLAVYRDPAAILIDQLKEIGIAARLCRWRSARVRLAFSGCWSSGRETSGAKGVSLQSRTGPVEGDAACSNGSKPKAPSRRGGRLRRGCAVWPRRGRHEPGRRGRNRCLR